MEPILFKKFDSISEAELAKNILIKKGIKSFIEKGGLQFPGDSGDMYGADLYVLTKDLKQAEEILNL
ncbi:MAG: hypothetical protein WC508_00160 [Patescibacteria group bacterium]